MHIYEKSTISNHFRRQQSLPYLRTKNSLACKNRKAVSFINNFSHFWRNNTEVSVKNHLHKNTQACSELKMKKIILYRYSSKSNQHSGATKIVNILLIEKIGL